MSDFSKILDSVRSLNKTLVSNQQQIVKLCSVSNQLADTVATINQMHQHLQQALTPPVAFQTDLVLNIKAQQKALVTPIRQAIEKMNASLSSDIFNSLDVNDSFINLTEFKQESLLYLTSAFHDIHIYENYVSIPKTLIPDDYQYDEILDSSEAVTKHNVDKSSRIKRLSLSDALNIINMVVVILMTVLAPFYNHAVGGALSETEDTETVAPMTEEQAQQLLKYLSELTTYQQTIVTALETSEESIREHSSYLDDTQPYPVTPDSEMTACDECCPTSVDEPGSSE